MMVKMTALWCSLGERLRDAFINIYFGSIVEVLRFYVRFWVCATYSLAMYPAGVCGTQLPEMFTPGFVLIREPDELMKPVCKLWGL